MKFNYEKLKVTNEVQSFVKNAYKISESFPSSEVYGMTKQLRRAAVSILLNLAEGSIRSKKEYVRFLNYSLGSLLEVDAVLKLASSMNMINLNAFINYEEAKESVFYKLYHLRESQK